MYTKDLENKLNKVKCTGGWKAKTRQTIRAKKHRGRTNTQNYTAMKFETLREVDKLQPESHFSRLEEVEKAQEVFILTHFGSVAAGLQIRLPFFKVVLGRRFVPQTETRPDTTKCSATAVQRLFRGWGGGGVVLPALQSLSSSEGIIMQSLTNPCA